MKIPEKLHISNLIIKCRQLSNADNQVPFYTFERRTAADRKVWEEQTSCCFVYLAPTTKHLSLVHCKPVRASEKERERESKLARFERWSIYSFSYANAAFEKEPSSGAEWKVFTSFHFGIVAEKAIHHNHWYFFFSSSLLSSPNC